MTIWYSSLLGNYLRITESSIKIGLWCLAPLWTIFQLYHDGKLYKEKIPCKNRFRSSKTN